MKKLFFLTLGLGLLWTPVGFGDTDSEIFDVKANVIRTCDLIIPDGNDTLDFGDYDGKSDVHAGIIVAVNCTDGLGYTISTAHPLPDLIHPTSLSMPFNLFIPDTPGVPCDGTETIPLTTGISETGDGNNQEWGICGVINAGEIIEYPGIYEANVNIDVTFDPLT